METAPEVVPVAVTLKDGRRVVVRAIRADDDERLQSAVRAMSDDSRYARFMGALRELPPRLVDRATRPEPGREVQLVAVIGTGSEEEIVAGARYASEPGSRECEFAVAVVDGWHGVGLARRMLVLLIEHARARGFASMVGYILGTNARMLELARRLGFVAVESSEGPTVRKVRRDLASPVA